PRARAGPPSRVPRPRGGERFRVPDAGSRGGETTRPTDPTRVRGRPPPAVRRRLVRRGHGRLRCPQPGRTRRGPRRDGASAQARRPVGRAGVHYSDLATVPRPLLLLLPPHPPADRADDLEARLRLRLP